MDAPTAASAASIPWWVAYPDRLAGEKGALAAAGATWSEDIPENDLPTEGESSAAAADSPGPLALRVHWPHPDPRLGDPATLELLASFPVGYPWWAPKVTLPEPLPGLSKHRNPSNGALCLLADSGDWRPGTTLADLLTVQLPRLLAAGRDLGTGAAVLGLESGAEAAWTRLRLSPGALLVDAGCLPPAQVPAGWAEVVPISRSLGPVFATVSLFDAEGQLLWSSGLFGARKTSRIRWVRLTELPIDTVEPGALWQHATARLEQIALGAGGAEPNAIAILVPSEGRQRRPREEWLLLNRGLPRPELLESSAAHQAAEPEQTAPPLTTAPAREASTGEQLTLFDGRDVPAPRAAAAREDLPVRVRRSYPIGRDDLTARLPGHTAHLAQGSVTVVGVGALGGPLALELARAGIGRLHLIDGDLHDPATAARQLPSLQDAGNPKALAVALRIIDSHPHVDITCGLRDLGEDDGRELSALVASRLVVDCTANPAATRFLAAHLRLSGTPLLVASATTGGWGGTITALPAAGGGCWECLQLHRADRSVPWPPEQPDGQLLPAGCSEPTFVGGWYDLGQVVLQAARTALSMLTTNTRVAGSPFGDLQVLTQYRRGRPVHPRWQSRRLTVHPACPLHPPAPHGASGATAAQPAAGARSPDPGTGPATESGPDRSRSAAKPPPDPQRRRTAAPNRGQQPAPAAQSISSKGTQS